jgi:hypothetical protein
MCSSAIGIQVRLRIELHDAINAQHRHVARDPGVIPVQDALDDDRAGPGLADQSEVLRLRCPRSAKSRVSAPIPVRLSFNKNSVLDSSKTRKS